MTCAEAARQLDDHVDGTLAPAERDAMAAHLALCPACAGLASDLARIRTAARALGPMTPPAIVWSRIAGALPRNAKPAVDSATPAPRVRTPARWIGLAAAVLVAAATAYVALATRSQPAAPGRPLGAGNAGAQDSVKTIEQDLQQADRLYSDAIARLEAIADADAATIDPAIAASLRDSQTVLDRAIAESRAAVDRDPTNDAARISLFAALRRKVRLLQDTIALVGEAQDADAGSRAGAAGRKSS